LSSSCGLLLPKAIRLFSGSPLPASLPTWCAFFFCLFAFLSSFDYSPPHPVLRISTNTLKLQISRFPFNSAFSILHLPGNRVGNFRSTGTLFYARAPRTILSARCKYCGPWSHCYHIRPNKFSLCISFSSLEFAGVLAILSRKSFHAWLILQACSFRLALYSCALSRPRPVLG